MMPYAFESLPRTFLRDRLVEREAAPLEPSLRGFMEEKFRTALGDVRIHAGPAAAGLCAALNARAFAWGHDLVFGRGEYAPAGKAGQWLLAHELVHVLQQRSASRPAQLPDVPIGDLRDDCESEADRLAEQALGIGLRSAVTSDATGAIRRAIRVLADSAEMKVNRDEATPVTYVNMPLRSAFLYLNKNEDPIIYQQNTASEQDASAINIQGQVDVELGPRDDLSKWGFRFIQLAKTSIAYFAYAGRQSSHGSMYVHRAIAPALPAKYVHQFTLDSTENLYGKNVMPFMNLRAPLITRKRGGIATVSTDLDDHPHLKCALVIRNAETNLDNYLYHAIGLKEYITAFVVRDKAGVIQPLAHVDWHIFWQATYRWEGTREQDILSASAETRAEYVAVRGADLVYTCLGSIADRRDVYVGKVIKGPPADTNLAAMITNPTADVNETAQALSQAAIKALNLPGIYNIKYAKRRSPDVPSGFFK
jgi:hypothetical protein